IEWLAESFQQKHDIDLRKDKMALQRLRDAAEKAKIDLSNADASDINLPFIYSGEKGSALHLQERLDRATLESLVKNLVDRTIEISKNTLKTAGLQPKDLSAVLLVGGMSRMPYVQRSVEEFFGLAPSKNVHPDEVVSAGAAIQGYLLSSGGAETLLLDVTPHHLGIMVAGGLFDVIIEKDTTIPTSANKIFTTIRDNQEQVRIIVLQGQSSQADKNELLGEFVLDGLRGAPRGEVKVDVTFSISADGIVSVSARNLESDREQKITVTASSGLSEEEIRQMAEENEESLVAAAASDELEQKRLEVQRILQDIDKLLPKVRPVIGKTDFGVEALARAERSMDKARAAIENNSLDELSACKEPLERTASLLSGVIEKLTS
ncbi:Hsp70 family protein, partial [Myxococcota bacterium]|nr:Hsp70 family protein [Myxococcota bacterium]